MKINVKITQMSGKLLLATYLILTGFNVAFEFEWSKFLGALAVVTGVFVILDPAPGSQDDETKNEPQSRDRRGRIRLE